MKYSYVFISFVLITNSLDICTQLLTYDQCIATKQDQCRWDVHVEKCKRSNNYLIGCEKTLSQKLCVKQFGTITGELGLCIFRVYCQTIIDFDKAQCTDPVSKGGCLAITNPSQFCKWFDGQCISMVQSELNNIQATFADYELSASVCPIIDGYLILHHSILWPLLEYTPDLITESENLVKQEAGITVTKTTSYDQGLLQNNYVDSNGYFKWYQMKSTKSSTESNLKINDKSRYGCIAQEILSDSNFLILFQLTGTIRSVNHIYCKYLNRHPTNPQLTLFVNNRCIPITESQLKDQTYLSQYSLNCQSMGPSVCQRYQNFSKYCYIIPFTSTQEKEYSCVPIKQVITNPTCQALTGYATYDSCASGQYCFLNIQSTEGYCDQSCYTILTQETCDQSSQCKWTGTAIGLSSISDTSGLLACIPKLGCDNLGVSQNYCQQMIDTCGWDSEKQLCYTVNKDGILKCEQANTKYTCSTISLSDQLCFWMNDKCYNFLDQPLFSYFKSLPNSIIMNRLLCMHLTSDLLYYDPVSRTCQISYQKTIQCQNQTTQTETQCNYSITTQISKYFCLNIVASYTKWDSYENICINQLEENIKLKQCETLTLVNPKSCRIAIVDSSNYCLHDAITNSCYVASKASTTLKCSEGGISKQLCTTITTPGQFCQFMYGKCIDLKGRYLQSHQCLQLSRVNPNVCEYLYASGEKCYYDSTEGSCVLQFVSPATCEGSLNAFACQQSSGQCYYNFVKLKCQTVDSTLINILNCEGFYLSKSACEKITTNGQACYWEQYKQKCMNYTSYYTINCDTFSNLNKLACTKLATLFTNQFVAQSYCEYNSSGQCISSVTAISSADCGYTTNINIHRCVGYTNSDSKKCYWSYSENKCKTLSTTSQEQQLQYNQLTCNQTNINLCPKVTTIGQICNAIQSGTTIKCGNVVTVTTDTCTNLVGYSMTTYNQNICVIASDSCFYDQTQSKCGIPATTTLFKCNSIISATTCIKQSYGPCVVTNRFCQPLSDYTTACNVRNQYSCLLGGVNCQWVTTTTPQSCVGITDYCPTAYVNSSSIRNWITCSLSIGDCFASINGCSSTQLTNLPCWIGINSSLCQSQSHFCQWIDFIQCVDYRDDLCTNAQTQDQCIKNRNPQQFCVYQNGQCFSADTTYRCDQFTVTSPQFCSQFSLCIYTADYQCLSYKGILDSKQIDSKNLYNYKCSSFTNKYECVFQRNQKCTYVSTPSISCSNSSITSCIQSSDQQYSITTCEQFSNCYFATTNQGEGFCYENTLTCEALNASLCVKDIPGLKCYYDNTTSKCLTNTFTNCDQIIGKKVNYQTCVDVSTSSNICIYDINTNLCKKKHKNTITTCSSATNIQECAFATNLNCLINYSGSSYSSCSNGSASHIDTSTQTNNLFGCSQLGTEMYVFDISTYKCHYIANGTINAMQNDLLLVNTCLTLNQKACTQISGEVLMNCIWDTTLKQCRYYNKSDESIPCAMRNQLNCQKAQLLNCIWKAQSCQLNTDIDISICGTSCLFSSKYCLSQSSTNQYIPDISQQCFQITSLPLSFDQCEYIGLNRQSCLQNTNNLYCYWNGNYCQTANLYTLLCSEDVSERTCNAIVKPNQNCNWNTSISQCHTITNSTCSAYNNHRLSCISQNLECKYESATNQCLQTDQKYQECSSDLSKLNCKNVINEICMYQKGECTQWVPYYYSCSLIINKYGCYYSDMICIWTETNGCQNYDLSTKKLCKDQPIGLNKQGCIQMSTDKCSFDNSILQCSYQLTGSEIVDLSSLSQDTYSQPLLTSTCSSFNTFQACIGVRTNQQLCQWTGSSCINSQFVSCQNQNIWGCLNQPVLACAWRDSSCVAWKYNSSSQLSIQQLTQVSINVCKNVNKSLYAKYNTSTYSCENTDLSNDNCDTKGINYFTCLQLKSYKCQFTSNECKTFSDFTNTTCDAYKNVSALVCQSIPDLACKYNSNTYSCQSVQSTDICTSEGLSRYGCINITSSGCEWDGTKCIAFVPDNNSNQCDNSTFRNSVACTSIAYFNLPCSFDQQSSVCTPIFNKYGKCNTPGLNKNACFQIEREPCQFTTKCISFSNSTYNCYEVGEVNAYACRILQTGNCGYDEINHECKSTQKAIPCNYNGLNRNGCLITNYCGWNSDQSQCYCKLADYEDKCSLTQDQCIQSSFCTYSSSTCRMKYCDDLIDCQGSVNGYICYKNQQNQCLGAKQCEDIVFLNNSLKCEQFVLSGTACQSAGYKQCVSPTNFQLMCPYTDCQNQNCIMAQGICRDLRCEDLSISNCQSKINCAIINNQCTTINSCSEITEETQCNKTTVGEFQCNWQEYGILDDTKWCTNNLCGKFGPSRTLCHGNEINDFTCALTYNLTCKMCEQITDMCECNNVLNACYFRDGQCHSMLCINFYNADTCTNSGRCYWSTQDEICRKMCVQNIKQDECDALEYECHWNKYKNLCEQGKEEIPDLSVKIKVQDIKEIILRIVIYSILLLNI